MRAPFNTTVTLFDGPSTATPGFPRVVDAPCRVVSDLHFQDFDAPLSESLAYFTMEIDEPRASTNTPLGGGKWEFDFGRADRAIFASFPDTVFVVVRVELCTWPKPGAPYWRASIAEDVPTPTACQEGYPDVFNVVRTGGTVPSTITRTGLTTWSEGGAFMEAETTAVDPETCTSTWTFEYDGYTWTGTFNGVGFGEFTRPGDPFDQIVIWA